jgi:uncharacterized membrane protein
MTSITSDATQYTIKRIGALLHRISPIVDGAGRIVHYVASPLMVELRRRDIMQILVGAALLAIPVGFTEEVWRLGEQLPLANVLGLAGISLTFIAAFVFFNFYRELWRAYWLEYVKRVAAIYLLSLLAVGVLLTLIEAAPWGSDSLVALKRIVIVAFPASMSAAVSDSIK